MFLDSRGSQRAHGGGDQSQRYIPRDSHKCLSSWCVWVSYRTNSFDQVPSSTRLADGLCELNCKGEGRREESRVPWCDEGGSEEATLHFLGRAWLLQDWGALETPSQHLSPVSLMRLLPSEAPLPVPSLGPPPRSSGNRGSKVNAHFSGEAAGARSRDWKDPELGGGQARGKDLAKVKLWFLVGILAVMWGSWPWCFIFLSFFPSQLPPLSFLLFFLHHFSVSSSFSSSLVSCKNPFPFLFLFSLFPLPL